MTRHSPHILALALFLTAPTAHAGPTVSADLDLGTSTKHDLMQGSDVVLTSPLYVVGFALRVGWRFDVRSFFLQPEIGGGYAVERSTTGNSVGRAFGGGRVGWSGVVGPQLRIEPAIFGHAGAASYGSSLAGSVFDAGVSLDLRVRGNFLVGVHGGYTVVTVWYPTCAPLQGAQTTSGPVCASSGLNRFDPPPALPPQADPWVGYGVHAGWLFW
jgi:hypothetical protein